MLQYVPSRCIPAGGLVLLWSLTRLQAADSAHSRSVTIEDSTNLPWGLPCCTRGNNRADAAGSCTAGSKQSHGVRRGWWVERMILLQLRLLAGCNRNLNRMHCRLLLPPVQRTTASSLLCLIKQETGSLQGAARLYSSYCWHNECMLTFCRQA